MAERIGAIGVFVGYSDENKAYRVLVGQRVVVERNVKVLEEERSEMPSDSTSGGKGAENEHHNEMPRDNVSGGRRAGNENDNEDEMPSDSASGGSDENSEDEMPSDTMSGGNEVEGASEDMSDDDPTTEDEHEEAEETVAVTRSGRIRRPNRDPDFVYAVGLSEPQSLKEARKGGEWGEWQIAMKREMESLKEYGTFDLVDRPEGVDVIDNRIKLHLGQDW